MTMHMMSPAFTTTGKKKGKQKFKSAEAAAKARKNAENWQQLLEKWDVKPNTKKTNSQYVNPADAILRERSNRSIPSIDTGVGDTTKKEVPQYTGDAMIGIGTLHKSNAVPVFKQEDAEDLAKMRR